MYYVLKAKSISAEEAERISMITRPVEDGKLRHCDTRIKTRTLPVSQAFSTPDWKEGMAAFAEKCKANYTKYYACNLQLPARLLLTTET